MPKTPRPHKFQIRLSAEEWQMSTAMAQKEGLQRSDLFRLKTLYKLPRRQVTKIAASTYWQLAQQTDNLNQIARELETANRDGNVPKSGTLRELQNLLNNNMELLTQVRKELVELDLLDWQDSEEEDDWQANQG